MSNPRYIELSDDPDMPCPVFTPIVLDHRFIVTFKGKDLINVSVREAVLNGMLRGGAPTTRLDLSAEDTR